MKLTQLIKEKILYLDGATGTEIQKYNLEYDGNNEGLNLSHPHIIKEIHTKYLKAGSNIISTNTFGATRIGQSDYNKQHLVKEINFAAARLACQARDDFGCGFVAGSIGPTNKTLSMSPKVEDPSFRSIEFDELVNNYDEQINALVNGGVDILLIETIFDTLNSKAAIKAAMKYDKPIMLSVTITDKSGRTLSGQTIEAFWNSVRHCNPFSVGINCALGAKDMKPYVETLSEIADCYISVYPNAGLPNPLSDTGYDEGPADTASHLYEYNGYVNVLGGCCGVTPEHIEEIIRQTKDFEVRKPSSINYTTKLSGLEPLCLDNFTIVGERTNVAGSIKFKNLIKQNKFDEAISIARQQIDAGAQIIDINFDDGLLDGVGCMSKYLKLLAGEPEISKVPFMLDSSRWDILEEGIKLVQGKCIVNSISLKDGEEEFLSKAKYIKLHGAAAIVMAFDEKGQAATYEDKVRICQRSYDLLDTINFPEEDIIFDCNVLTVGTGIDEHNTYAIDFIDAVREVKRTCPGVKTSAGVSNVSFAFRGNNPLRNAIHSVFLFHAIEAGLDMAIVNAGVLPLYHDIDKKLIEKIENLLFNKTSDATEVLVETAVSKSTVSQTNKLAWREDGVEDRIIHALTHGIVDYIIEDIKLIQPNYSQTIEIIEGPLMDGMKVVGKLFGEGKMFLPQVVKSARVMKKAVGYLEDFITTSDESKQETIVLATVKGDVHDIGKNIVSVVLACNGYKIIDLGVMVDFETIIEAAKENKADFIGMSGLITPSLDEMIKNIKKMNSMGMDIPILIGGATTSKTHTAVKIAPHYDGTIVQVGDASQAALVCSQLKDETYKEGIKISQTKLKHRFETRPKNIMSISDARDKQKQFDGEFEVPFMGSKSYSITLEELCKYIDWTPFFNSWGFKGKYPQILDKFDGEPRKLFNDTKEMLDVIVSQNKFKVNAKVNIFECYQEDDDIIVGDEKLHFLRQQSKNNLCLSDFTGNTAGAFVCSISGVEEYAKQFDDYKKIIVTLLGDRFAEALAEAVNKDTKAIIRPAPGYPGCPDHHEKKTLFKLLQPDFADLTDSCMVSPPSSVCGYYFFNPHSKYFVLGDIGQDQIDDYAGRKGWDAPETYKWLGL